MMNEEKKYNQINSKKTITAILLAVIVLLLICIFVKGCIEKEDTSLAPTNNVTQRPTFGSTVNTTQTHNNTDIQTASPSQNITQGPTETIKPTATLRPTATLGPTEKPSGATPNEFTQQSFPTSTDKDGVYSRYAYMIDLESNKVVYEKNADLAMYPASMTKIMTVILALENIENYDKKITMDSDFYDYLDEEGASVAGFVAGEKVTAEMLLYGAMLVSGAECCIQLAREVAGTEEAFFILMNKKAQELGMLNTHYNSSTGLFHPDNYTTVRDVAILMEYAMKNETFMEIITAKKYVGDATNKHTSGFTLHNKVLASANDHIQIRNGKFIGGKTGYIMKAGVCLASIAEINGRQYILVTAGANKSFGSTHFLDANHIYNNFKNF